jgi:tetratricopeptide (TPR) repeat protein
VTTVADALIEAHRLAANGESDRARTLLLAIVEQSPTPIAGALALLGRLAKEERRPDEALEWLAAAVEAAPDEPLHQVAVAGILLERGEAAEAEAILRDVVAHWPDCGPARIGLGLALARRGHGDEAVAHLQAAAERDPESASIRFHLGNLLLAAGRAPEAEAELRRACRLAPGDPDTSLCLGLALRAQNCDEDALAPMRAACAMPQAASAHFVPLGELLLDLGDTASAEAAFRRALELAPDDTGAHVGLGRTRLAEGRPATAAADFRRAAALTPEAWPLHIAVGDAMRLAGRAEEARTAYARATHLKPDHGSVGAALLNLGAGDTRAGWAAIAARWRQVGPPFSLLSPPGPHWDGAPLPGLALLVDATADAAIALPLLRFLPAARARVGRLAVVCRPELRRLLAALEGVDVALSEGEVPGGFAAHVAIEALPSLLEPAGPPRIPVGRTDFDRWGRLLDGFGDGKRLGLWLSGSPGPLGLAPAITAAALSFLPRLKHLTPILLAGEGVSAANASPLAAGCTDLADCAALLARLDLLICADGPAAHLAAALGVPTLVVLAQAPGWPWQAGWYGPHLRTVIAPAGRDERIDQSALGVRLAGELSNLT